MPTVQQKFKVLEEELDLNPHLTKDQKGQLKRFLSDEKRKVQLMYQILVGHDEIAGGGRFSIASPLLGQTMNETFQQALSASEKAFRDKMERCIQENQKRTDQALQPLSATAHTPVADLPTPRPQLQAAKQLKHQRASFHDAISGLVDHHRNLMFKSRDTSRDTGVVDRVVGQAVQDACFTVQTLTFPLKISIIAIEHVSETASSFLHRTVETLANAPVGQAYASARDALAERIEHNHGVDTALTVGTMDDLVARAAFRLPRQLTRGCGPRTMTAPAPSARGMAAATHSELSGAPASTPMPTASILSAKSQGPGGRTFHGSSRGTGSGGHPHGVFSRKKTNKTVTVTEDLGGGVTQVKEKQLQQTEVYHDGKTTRVSESSVHTRIDGVLELEFTNNARKAFEKMEKRDQIAIMKKLEQLRMDPFPRGRQKVKCSDINQYRIKQGDNRIVYTVGDGRVLTMNIGPRENFYRDI